MGEYSHKPQLSENGLIYCSPACGSKCTKEAYDLAVSRAQALAEKLGEGWEPHVWENGGWHYQAKNKTMTVYCHHYWNSETPQYSAWIEPELTVSGKAFQIIEYADDPNDALGIAKQKAWDAISRIRQALTELETVL
ncbi:hypothetical protein [Agrobacterium tumefaciens]|uniref:hypothetical protein n=1 Tax=Agrobacterium tumefaciens TaxID=358 RepID=UPI000A9C6B3D|nr:hypothetical protein [Agrobacterium tumefaciens]